MKRALLHETRLCEVRAADFPVAPPLRWIDCADNVTPETHDFDGTNFVLKPAPPTSMPDPAVVARMQLDQDERAAAKIDNAVMVLVNSKPAELQTFAQNNFPSLTVAERNRMAIILSILAVAVRPVVR
jgi:hypothetical protein